MEWTLKNEMAQRGMSLTEACRRCDMDKATMEILLAGGETLPRLALKVGRGLGLTREQTETIGQPLQSASWGKDGLPAPHKIDVAKDWTKYLTEKEKCKWFAQAGLMDVYVDKRFASYIKNWHFDALSHVAESQREICTRRLYDIVRLYESYYHGGDAKLDAFIAACKKGSWTEAYSAAVIK